MKLLNNRYTAFLLTTIIIFVFVNFIAQSVETWKWHKVLEYRTYLLSGFWMTILLSILSLLIASIGGILLYTCKHSSFYVLRYLSSLFYVIVEATPMIVYVLIGYYIVANSLGISNRILAGVLILGSFYAVVFAKMIQGGIKSIHHTQWLTAYSLGFSKFQKYWYIIIPQLWTKILPTMTYQTASLIKDSALLSIISIREFYQVTTNTANQTYSTLEFYLIMALGYFILTIPLKIIAEILEKKFNYEN